MRLIFIGPPGSGKGTQTKLLCKRLGLTHISTGDILRDSARQGTPEGRLAKPFLDGGRLAPDEIVNDIINARLRAPDRPTRFVMDGYPRNVQQAESFDRVLREQGLSLDAVVLLNVDDREIVNRLSARWSCPNPKCQATYNLYTRPPKSADTCDDCGTRLAQRDDDKAETVRERLRVYHGVASTLGEHYRKQGLAVDVPGSGDIETIYGNIIRALPQAALSQSSPP